MGTDVTVLYTFIVDVNNCEFNLCVNGSCVDGVNNYTCACDSGFSGTYCSKGDYFNCPSIEKKITLKDL